MKTEQGLSDLLQNDELNYTDHLEDDLILDPVHTVIEEMVEKAARKNYEDPSSPDELAECSWKMFCEEKRDHNDWFDEPQKVAEMLISPVLDAERRAVREIIENERLTDSTGTPEDEAYNMAIEHVLGMLDDRLDG